jgi:hypothetical protein
MIVRSAVSTAVVALVVVVLVAGAGAAYYFVGMGAPASKTSPTSTAKTSSASGSSTTSSSLSCESNGTTPQMVVSDFKSNQAAANARWLGKTICFSDYVGSVNENSVGQYLSCMWYGTTALQPQSGWGGLSHFNGWIIYY